VTLKPDLSRNGPITEKHENNQRTKFAKKKKKKKKLFEIGSLLTSFLLSTNSGILLHLMTSIYSERIAIFNRILFLASIMIM
jgi:hypothetical protein